jgi:hypothetical protein
MKSLGLRVEKDKIHWAVVEGTVSAPVLSADDKFSAPETYDEAQQLAWYRQRLRTLIEDQRPDIVAVRFSETFLQHKPKPNVLASMFARARIEGVAIEAASSLNLPVISGQLGTISAAMGSRRAKSYLETGDLRGIDLSKKSANRAEAILAAVAALGRQRGDR